MRFNPIPLIVVLVLCCCTGFAQVVPSPHNNRYTLSLKSGSFIPLQNIADTGIAEINRKALRAGGKSFLIIQFENIPTENEKKQLAEEGIELLEYIPNNAYTATITRNLNIARLRQLKARAIIEPTPAQKMEPALATGMFPNWAVKAAGTVDVWVSFPKTFSYETVNTGIKARNFDIISTDFKGYNILALRIPVTRLLELAALPFIEYVQTAPGGDEPLNNKSKANSRANILNSSLPGHHNLSGEGIVVGVGDDSDPTRHIDFRDRLINRSSSVGGSHGLHVTGTVGSAGLVREEYAGYAPKSTLISQRFSGILAYAPEYVQDHGMVITNNSYGNPNDCTTFGVYDLYARVMDLQMLQMPNLQHVFAAGNSGLSNCSPYANGFGNVYGGYQTAKNIIAVGNANVNGVIDPSSSKGPVRDGRIKPEITAQGVAVWSTWPISTYNPQQGTSMAAPAVSGGLALLYQRYKQLHGGANPKNGLMKALLVNGATDRGNSGPDFSYGFGWMNLLRSVKMLDNSNYFNTTVNNTATNNHSITIPAGSSIAQLKVMLYWNDAAANVLASSTLVNDLDLTVTDPSSVVHFPQLLNTTPANVNSPATTGADHINNIEQVVINNPAPGTYTFSVKGTTIPFTSNYEYFLVFDTIPVSTVLTYPAGDEHLKPGDAIYVQWESYGNPANDFTVQYSVDNGSNWSTVPNGANVADSLRQLAWTVPAGATDQARVKLIHNGTGIESISELFTVIGVPDTVKAYLAADQCEGYINMHWPAVAGASDYEVMLLQGNEWIAAGTTTDTSYLLKGLARDTTYWFTARARINGKPGRRAMAASRLPFDGSCPGTMSDKDLKIDAVLLPAQSGRKFTSTELSATQPIRIRIENLDNAATSGNIPVSYTINNNPPVNETIIVPPNIGNRSFLDYTFTTRADMSAPGTYDLKVSVSYPGDPVVRNDTMRKTFKQLDNPAINLATPFIDDLETAPVQALIGKQIGLQGLNRYDFNTTTVFGQIRSYINTGMAYSGTRALTIDADRFNNSGTTDSLTGTFNLQGYDATTDEIRLDFVYKHHGQQTNAANKVWIRGNDTQPWIEIYNLYNNQEPVGTYKKAMALELSNLLSLNSQNFSSSFQVRWGQWGKGIAADNEGYAGYTFDDIRIYTVSNDLQMVSIDTPVAASCGLNSAVPVKVTIRNTDNSTIPAIPVKIQIDNGTPVPETISSIGPNATIQYTFTTTADFSALGSHSIKVWLDLAADTYKLNDTASLVLYNSPVIASFPYLQNFELGDGSWHAEGKNSSWQYGLPASTKINRAASGSKAWKTRLVGNYNDLEESYLYSPCFDVTGMAKPMLSFSVAMDIEDCGATLCDAAFVEYSTDGRTWSKLGANGTGTNWYNKIYTGNNHVWSVQNYTRWHVASIPLPAFVGNLQLRFGLESDPFTAREGIAIDDIHIYDSVYSIYNGPPYTSAVSNQPVVNGSNWINFVSNGKLIASVNPNGQNLGSTDVQAYIYTGAPRTNTGQYYHNRNITIKPTNVNLSDSVLVRFYFLDTETEALINATGCGGCSKPASAYELGVTKYSNVDDAVENGTLADNFTGGNHLFIVPNNVVKVPFDKGYYAEFKVKDFSEFWLNNGGSGNNTALPVELVSFTAKKNSTNVLVEWVTGSENNTSHFEVELARGNEEFRLNHFFKIGEVQSQGNSSTEQYYLFTDDETNKQGVRYYRLKMIDHDGKFSYSPVRAVVFDEEIKWQIYPNPSSGIFNLIYQATEGETVTVKVYDINGQLVRQLRLTATAFVQKSTVDLSGPQFAAGMYMLEVGTGEKKQVFRLLKH